MAKPIVINSKEISLLKPVTYADYSAKTVLTNSAWMFVELWFKRNRNTNTERALFFWQQAKHFYNASDCLPINSKPLTSYYCCLNAAKALLSIKGISLAEDIGHGISQNRHTQINKNSLEKAQVIFLGAGVLTELSRYFDEDVTKKVYFVKDLLYNIPCIHRAFSITYGNSPELFIPIRSIKFVRNETSSDSWIQFEIDSRYANGTALMYLPTQYKKDPVASGTGNYIVRKENHRFRWNIHEAKDVRFHALSDYHKKVRKDIHYIYGDQKMWYIKKNIPNNTHILKRNSITLIFAVMHWLSELVRYNPMLFEKYMKTNQNWLLNEFIETALPQFIDEISCEITGRDILATGYRK